MPSGYLDGNFDKGLSDNKKAFESLYGEGCFSCPGQAFETMEQSASVHNVAPELILDEINNEIEKELKPS